VVEHPAEPARELTGASPRPLSANIRRHRGIENTGLMTGRVLRLALPMAAVAFLGASSPWVAQRVPRFLFPAVAAAGAALVMVSFVNSVGQVVRHYRGEGRSLRQGDRSHAR
jgi:hypothetical protein